MKMKSIASTGNQILQKRVAIYLFLLIVCNLTAAAQALPTLRVLTIGNSFSEDAVEQNLYELGREAGYNLIIGNAYRGGQGLQSHWNVVTQGEAAFEYRKVVDGKRTNRKGVLLDSIIVDEPWDIITLQQVSQDAGLYSTYDPYLQELLHHVQKTATAKQIRFGFHQTWAYARNATHKGFANYGNDQGRMYQNIVGAVGRALNDHTELVFCVPSGTAIQNMRTTPLGDHMNRDGYHLDLTAARYTAACTWLEALTGVSPVGLQYRPKGISSTVALMAQQAAHDAILHPDAVTEQTSAQQYLDTCRISVFGSSVAHGTGAANDQGYAYQYGQLLQQRTRSGKSPYPFTISNISIGGNTTADLLRRYNDLIFDLGRYVVFGLSLGNEGIHNSSRAQKVMEGWRDNMLRLVEMAREDGKVPVVMGNYGRADYNAKDYALVKHLNLLIHQWDVPSVNLLGAVDDGQGRWPSGFENDMGHPNTAGHREMMLTIPPSLFDALAEGKPLPVRDATKTYSLTRGNTINFVPEGTTHPFAVSVTVKGSDRGRVMTFVSGGRRAWVGINKDHRAYYCSTTGDSLVCYIPIEENVRHTITVSHRYAQRHTLFFVDNEGSKTNERMQLDSVMVGDYSNRSVKRRFSELFFWRSALNSDEVSALSRGAMLKSSLEIYTPLDDGQRYDLPNLAQSLNRARLVPYQPARKKSHAPNPRRR